MASKDRWRLAVLFPAFLVFLLFHGGEGGVHPLAGGGEVFAATRAPHSIYLPGILNSNAGPAPSPTPSSQDPVLIGAGDVSACGVAGAAQTAALLAANPGTVMLLGDGANPDGTLQQYQTCYDPYWGQFKKQTKPAVGNHDYLTPGAAGYFAYFGAAAGDPTRGYYSFNLGAWHIVVLNSNCVEVGGCYAGNPQEIWLKADLAAHPAKCTLAIWHHPLFTSGSTPGNFHLATLYQDLYDAGAELLVTGHDHNYERFAPQNSQGVLDPTRGIVEIVAGAGGSNHTPLVYPLQPNSLASNDADFGVLKLVLHPTSYDWRFIPVSGPFTDSGTGRCH